MSIHSGIKNKYSFTWKIENYSSCYQNYNEKIESPPFVIESLGLMEWCLLCYPRSDSKENEEYIGLYFGKKTGKEVETIFSSYKIEIVGPGGEVLASNKGENKTFKDFSWGWKQFTKSDGILRKLKSWPEDILTVICTVVSPEPTKEIATGCIARTKVGLDRCSMRWNVKSPDSPDWSASKKFPFPGENPLEITMNAVEDQIIINIRCKTEESSLFIKCAIHLLDVEGVKRDSKSYEHFFLTGASTDSWELPPLISKKKLVQDSEKLVKNGLFTVVFDFSVSNGIEFNVIETYSYEPKREIYFFSPIDDRSIIVLQNDLRRLFENMEHADVCFKIGDDKVTAHKSILSARSPVLSKMLHHVEGNIEIFDVPDLNATTWNTFLEFLYIGTFISNSIDYESASKLLVIAEKYQVPFLKEKCTSFLSSVLSESNVVDILSLANKTGNETLKTDALDYIRSHAATILPGLDWSKWLENNSK